MATVTGGDNANPLRIPASGSWIGNDGIWSSFFALIGTPSQQVELLPGTSASAGNSVWAILPEGCEAANPTLDFNECSASRGDLFTRNESTTWSISRLGNNGLYNLNTYEESKLGLTGNAYYGFDQVVLGAESDRLPAMSDQVIAGIAANDFWTGTLGLSPLPMNFTTINDPYPSLLWHLRNASHVPSLSWAYTAGAYYKNAFGSLTFGGYDAARFNSDSNRLSVPFYADISRDLQVNVRSISYDTLGSPLLLADGIYTFINSMVTHLWLPISVCEAFEQAFGLVWNETAELYLLNATQHEALRAQNPLFTITLGASPTDDNTTTITLPYAAFDLNLSAPYVAEGESQPYFPLKRAQNDSQYTLGRVFLQEAYVVADYDRKNFTIAQAAFPSSEDETDLVAILPPDLTGSQQSGEDNLSTGALVSIIIGAVLLLLCVAVIVWLAMKKRKRRKAQAEEAAYNQSEGEEKSERVAVQEITTGHSQQNSRHDYELIGSTAYAIELNGLRRHQMPTELGGAGRYNEPVELGDDRIAGKGSRRRA